MAAENKILCSCASPLLSSESANIFGKFRLSLFFLRKLRHDLYSFRVPALVSVDLKCRQVCWQLLWCRQTCHSKSINNHTSQNILKITMQDKPKTTISCMLCGACRFAGTIKIAVHGTLFSLRMAAACASQSGKSNASSIHIKHERYSIWLGGTSSFHFVVCSTSRQIAGTQISGTSNLF